MICKPTKVVILKNKPPLLTGPLFTKLEISDKRIIIVQGGGDAAKTSTILQWLAVKCIQTNNIQATVVGMSGPNLKRGAIRLFKKYVAIDPQISPFLKTWNKTDKEQYFANGSILSFVSFEDDEEKARGAENDYVFMNEANLSSYNLFWQLQRKCRKKVILDYNPTFAFWAHAKLKNGGEKQFVDKVQMYIVDHRHNPFLTEEEHQAYEDISDPEMFKVYARGETGQTKGAIFKFKKVDKIPTKQVVDEKGNISEVELDFGFGIDIGYTTDKTAIIKAWTNAKDHYYKELLYKSNDEIQNEINENSLLDEAGKPQTIEGYIKNLQILRKS
jgi:phage terminase large subunit